MNDNRISLRWLFAIRRDERWIALGVVLVLMALHGLVIYHYNHIFMDPSPGYWARFLHHFHLSGYDPITYSVVTIWTAKYNVYRHPLLAFFVAPLCWLNNGLMALTGVNCVQYVVAAVWILFGMYAFLFSYRIQREIVGIGRGPAILLSAMLFGFAHVMVAAVAPDHFILSVTMLLLVIYICGTLMQQHRELSAWQTVILFFFTAGITLSNAVKVFLCALFTNGRSFFRLKYLALIVLLPSALIWTIARTEYHYLVLPQEKVAHAKKAHDQKIRREKAERKKAEAEKMFQMQAAVAAKSGDSLMLAEATARLDSVRKKPVARTSSQSYKAKMGKPISNGEFMRWTDITTSRVDAIVENLFGEGIQLHQDHVLGDVLRHRPVIVKYRQAWNYVVEFSIVLLFILGLIVGLVRHPRFVLMLLSCFAFDMLLHLGLGFGLNEVYIMSCHWIFIIPIAIGYLFPPARYSLSIYRGDRARYLLATGITALLTLWLWGWNLTLMARFLLTPNS